MVTKHTPESLCECSAGSVCVGRIQHYTCAVSGLVAAVVVVSIVAPLLFAVTQPLHFLSSTAVVFVLLLSWLLLAIALELLWEWRAGSLGTE
ncbi:hypothetical protein [Natronomonas sp. CBA1123]|jgi:predicted ABC-type exoprotein transport system permease subunit|uniref:hypothetical protein n=1 Tax=Natronomonas sp. CBA1123 TaxID=2668070 RepID=UPI001E2A172C|nr:hypothetical protein [Natronomonas sp. CBA1123]